jgi:2,3-bisphosphoglycerate-independent phosphoglycerate mutase
LNAINNGRKKYIYIHVETILWKNNVPQTMKRTVCLLILDGWGVGRRDITNAIYAANPPHFNALKSQYCSGSLLAHGIAIGLPWEAPGTGEAGHLTIGAGRAVYQPLPQITLSIRDRSFFSNPLLTKCFQGLAGAGKSLHLVGTLDEKEEYSSLEHIHALITSALDAGIRRIRIHAIIGAPGSGSKKALSLIEKIPRGDNVKIASIIGRHYAASGGTSPEKINQATRAILGIGQKTNDSALYMHDFYLHGLADEFAEPTSIGPDPRGIEEGDTIAFFDINTGTTKAFMNAIKESESLPKNISFVSLSDSGIPEIPTAFMADKPQSTLGTTLAAAGKNQFKIAETARYPHMTRFMNGLSDNPLPHEYRILIPGESVARQEERPEMMMRAVSDRAITAIEEGADFVALNLTAPDAVAHTGNFNAAVLAIKAADRELGNIAKAVFARNGVLVVTSDHGNAEEMRDPKTGISKGTHTKNPVPIILAAQEFMKNNNTPREETAGLLSDIAPTILALLGLEKPTEMTGSSLIGKL